MKYVKLIFIFLIGILQCFFCSQHYISTSNEYFLDEIKEKYYLEINLPNDITISDKEVLLNEILPKQEDIYISAVAYTTQYETFYVSGYNESKLQMILNDKTDVQKLMNHKRVIRHSGNKLEKTTYEFQLFNKSNYKKAPNRLVAYSSNMDALYAYKQDISSMFTDLEIKEEYEESYATQPSTWERIPVAIQESIPYVALVNIVLFVILLLSFSFDQKKIGILKLQGISSFHIMLLDLKKTVITYLLSSIFAIGCYFLYLYMDAGIISLLQPIFIYIIFQIAVFVLMFSVLWFLIYKSSILQGIKNGNPNVGLLWVNAIVKIVIVVILGIVLTNMCAQARLVYQEVQTSKNMLEFTKDSAKIEYIIADDNLTSEEYSDLFYKTVNALENNNFIYIDATPFEYDYKATNKSNEGYDMTQMFSNALRVNELFMTTFEIKDTKDRIVTFDNKTRTLYPYVFIPSSQWDETIINQLKHDERYQNFNYVKIKDNQEVFSFNAKAGIDDHGFIKDAIFVVDGNTDTSHYIINLQDVKGDTIDDKFNHWLRDNGIPSVYSFTEPTDMVKQVNDDLYGSLLQGIIQIMLLCIAVIIVIYQFIMMYILEHKKKIFIYRTLGVSFINRYDNLLLMHLLNYVIAIIIIMFLHAWTAMITMWFIFFFDSAILYIMLMKLETRSMNIVLKGGE